jgi:hypothetical protein
MDDVMRAVVYRRGANKGVYDSDYTDDQIAEILKRTPATTRELKEAAAQLEQET